jgi:hypothetical protein
MADTLTKKSKRMIHNLNETGTSITLTAKDNTVSKGDELLTNKD